MAKLPQQITLDMMQNTWATILEPIISNPSNKRLILKNVSLIIGPNSVNHRLGRKLQGYNIVRMRGVFAQVYDTQDQNPTPQLTLTLNSSADVVVDMEVF